MTKVMREVLEAMADGLKIDMPISGTGKIALRPVKRSTFYALRYRQWIRHTPEGYAITNEGLAALIVVVGKERMLAETRPE